ncbi:rRNA-binding ribosome biosynthesis protein utp25 [Elasticomyces elasticus]|uniref:U3 small nucleolar RNA-associated protein 25 n=1 Tax=Exophiala sideris TaxID=1016849 RepID=A0ABR0J4G0_9EURO|nr:rRNA-binding ribosome biosynthesis protein utp25 [Elasticomyces elasticus]KAK5027328.1 rRNA-binding ribosome biosynthesis protein utp25 [Exophiala sideris]KAK5034970.1 rRNA-binding ribosome biosynthesis protein utp25 [Exophiala sideris]KAK5056296.1 rRNA-binding ribosome biosynthesis protein utp25 [Exophiala sideris]KAK5181215.1 rRNA-binding ribosome biosynthesis protein utp25 [Eurotiomycetes sp. CCFEE 6388]
MPGFRGSHRGGKPAGRGRGGGRGRGRGRGRGGGHTAQNRDAFRTSRLKEEEDDEDDAQDDATSGDEDAELEGDDVAEDTESASEDEAPAADSYATLLQSLNAGREMGEPARKKRRIANKQTHVEVPPNGEQTQEEAVPLQGTQAAEADDQLKVLDEEVEEEEEHADTVPADADSDDEETMLKDPFEKHYSTVEEEDLKIVVKHVDEKDWQIQTATLDDNIRRTSMWLNGRSGQNCPVKGVTDLSLKRRLVEAGTRLASSLTAEERNVAGSVFNYSDIIYGNRNLKNSSQLRDLSCLHALNHIFKTRDRVLKNNEKLRTQSNADTLDLRDQGFTRPKVLIIVPTKQACVRFVDSIVKLSEPEQQENKARFLETYSHEDPDEWQDKPEDFRQLFGGNHEEDFRVGLKFTRKTIKYFSGFYNSDIIFGSPLGLMRTITTGGGTSKNDKKKAHDADFLSSIEVVIVDHANALQMQNWQHVDYVFSQLNLLPKDSHGCDFSRVRHWSLDGQAKYLRQTIIFSEFLTPEINALASGHMFNIAGRVKFQPTYPGAMLSVSSVLPTSVSQTFLRVSSANPLTDADARFKFFTTTILPNLVRDSKRNNGILLYATSYADFVRLRNHLSTSSDATSLSFGSISEYTPKRDVLRARSHFLSGRYALLLYSERAHHHFRYRLKGVKKIFFYSVPKNPFFWTEIIALLGLSEPGSHANGNLKGSTVRAMFSKWDALKLERIVGTERVGRLIHDRAGDTFNFV